MFAAKNNTTTSTPPSSITNKGVNSFIQPKLNIGESGDRYEVEADKAADQIVAKSNESSTPFFSATPTIQKQSEEETQKQDAQETEIQQQPVVDPITPGVQLKEESIIQEVEEEDVQKEEESSKEDEVQMMADEESAQQILAEDTLQTKEVFDITPISPSIQKMSQEDIQNMEEEEVQKSEEKGTEEGDLQLVIETEQFQESSIESTIQSKEASQDLTPILPIIQQMSNQDLQTKEEEEIQEKEEEEVQTLQKHISGDDGTTSHPIEHTLQSSKGGGNSLDNTTRSEMESGFGVDFSGVRVHHDSTAVQMNQQLGAQAFTNGNDIYFNEGKYNPNNDSGKHLLAHELTHTVQQGAADIQRKPLQISSAPLMVQRFAISDLPSLAVDKIKDIARRIPGYTLFTVVIEYNPITGQTVNRTAINLVQGLLELIPVAGPAIFDKLQEYGILERAFDWVRGQLNDLGLSSTAILDLIEEAWEELEFPYTDALEILTRKFNTLLNRVIRFVSALTDQLLTWVKEALIDVAEPYLEENQAWSLLKKVIHYDPLRDEEVEAETVEILEDFLMLIGKETELEQMRERGTLQETADWLDTQMGTFTSLLSQLSTLIDNAWDAIQPENLPHILDSLSALATDAGEFLQGLWDFASTVAIEVLKLIKDALLSWLNTFAADIPGFTLLTVIIRTNPLTGENVDRSVQNIIRGFMGLVPGGEAKYQELRESGVIPRAAGQIEALIAQLGMSATAIIQLFTDLWNSFTIDDLLDPVPAFERITAQFGEPISRLFQFVAKVVRVLVNLLLEIMGIPPELIGSIVANIMSAFENIKRDPIGFLLNLMNALKNGFINFLNNIGAHLLNGMQTWLFGTLADAGVEIPEDLSIRSLLGMAMDVLGITVDNVLDRLAEKIGPERMEQIRSVLDTLTGIWTFVKDVIERGPIAIWEYIQEKLSNLWEVIKSGIMGFIQEKVIQQAIGWLLSFLDVTGIMPIIRGVQTVFNAITSFIEKIREILGIVNSFVAGVADIARGSIQSAANFLETALSDGIPVAISFLAKQLGLGDISEKIAEMIENTREMINEGIDWLIDKAMEAGTAFLSALGLGGNDDTEEIEENHDPEKAAQIQEGLSNVRILESERAENGKINREQAEGIANTIRQNHPVFSSFIVYDGGDSWNYRYTASPETDFDTPDITKAEGEEVVFETNDLLMDRINENFYKVISNPNTETGQITLELLSGIQGQFTFNITTIQQNINSNQWVKLIPSGSAPVSVGDIIKAPFRTGSVRGYIAYIQPPINPGLVTYEFRGQNGSHSKTFEDFVAMISRQQIIIIRVDQDFLRRQTPSNELQTWAQSQLSATSIDPAFPSLTVDGTPQADHIVPFVDIINMVGFDLLTTEQQISVLNLQSNFIALSPRANASKGSKSYSQWQRNNALGLNVDTRFRRTMMRRETRARAELQNLIDSLVAENTL